MKKFLLAMLLLTVMVGTVYSGLRFTGNLTRARVSAPVVSSETLAMMPESDVVVLIDVGQILNTKLLSIINNDANASTEFKKFEAEALKFGIDIRQLRQVAIGARSLSANRSGKGFAIISGNFDREKILSAIATYPDKVSMESSEYNGKTLYIVSDKGSGKEQIQTLTGQNISMNLDKVGMAFLSSQMVVIGDLESVKNTIDVQSGKLPGVMSNAQMSSYLSQTNAGAMIRFASVVPDPNRSNASANAKPEPGSKPKVLTNEELGAPAPKSSKSSDGDEESGNGMSKMVEAIRGAYGSLDFAAGFQLDTTLMIRSDSEAKQMSDSLNGLLMLGKGALGSKAQQDPKQAKFLEAINHVNVGGTGRDVKITIDLSQQLLNELLTIFKNEQNKHSSKTTVQ